jgi:glucokinase
MLYTYDPSLIIFGGSVRHAYAWFQETMWTEIRKFAFGTNGMDLRIASSELENSGILGAAGLYYDRNKDEGSRANEWGDNKGS